MKNESLHLRCTTEFKEQVEKLAAKENRNVSNYLESLLLREIAYYNLKKNGVIANE